MQKIYVVVKFEIDVPDDVPEFNSSMKQKIIPEYVADFVDDLPKELKCLDYIWDYEEDIL